MALIKKIFFLCLFILLFGLMLMLLPSSDSRENFMENHLQRVETHFVNMDAVALGVSKASVGWHLYHILKVANSLIQALENSDPEQLSAFPTLSFSKTAVFLSGKMPRGVGKAPKSVIPPDEFTIGDLRVLVGEVRQALVKG